MHGVALGSGIHLLICGHEGVRTVTVRAKEIDAITQYLQAIALALVALWNTIMAYEAYPKIWRVLLSSLVALLLIAMAWTKAFPNYG